MLCLVVGYLTFSEACCTEVQGNSLSFSWALMEVADGMRWWKQHSEEQFLVCPWFLLLVHTAVRKSKWVPLPLCRSFLVGEPFLAQLGLLEVSELLGNLYCSKQRFFFSLLLFMAQHWKLEVSGEGLLNVVGFFWTFSDFLYCFVFCFVFVFFYPGFFFLVRFRTTKRAKLMDYREMASILSWSSVDICGGGT